MLEESYETLAELESNIQKTLCENADIDDNASIVSGYSATSVMPEKIGIEYKLGDAETETRSIEQIMEMQLDLPTFYLGDIDDEMTAQGILYFLQKLVLAFTKKFEQVFFVF